MEKAKKIGVSILTAAKSAESSLRGEEIKNLVGALPDGHILRQEVDRIGTEMGGDLAGLPDGHPLLLQLRAAEERYGKPRKNDDSSESGESSEQSSEQAAEERFTELKRAKKIEKDKKRAAQFASEEERASVHRQAATEVNKGIEIVIDSVRNLYSVLAEKEKVLMTDPISRARTNRLKQLLYAVERGIGSSKMNRTVNNAR